MRSLSLLVLLTILGPGCAAVHVERVTEKTSKEEEGVRYYEPAPYLLITDVLDSAGKVTSRKGEIIYLPDPDRQYRVHVQPGWGNVNGSVTLIDGWKLSVLGATMDSKGNETVTSLAGLATAAGAFVKQNAGGAPNKPELYKIVLNGAMANGVKFPSLTPVPIP